MHVYACICCIRIYLLPSGVTVGFRLGHPNPTEHAHALPGPFFLRCLVRFGVLQEDSVPFELSHGPLALPLNLTLELLQLGLFSILTQDIIKQACTDGRVPPL